MDKKVRITIDIDIKAALNTDVAHWLMASVQGWNNQMPRCQMTAVSLKTDGMAWDEMNETKLREFWDEWESKLPYDWKWKKNVKS
jgi:hypothetical protein